MSAGYDPVLSPLAHQPGILLIHLLNRCNLHCQHCYLDAGPWQNTFLPLDLVIRSISEAEQLGITGIYLTGGEPFLHPGFPEVLSSAAERQNLALYVSTNGTFIRASEALMLRDNRAHVQVSIDGTKAYHDKVRGLKGAFHRVTSGIKELLAVGVPVSIVTTICRDNMISLPWLAEWAAEMGVERVSIQPLLHLGRGSRIQDKMLSDEQTCELFLMLSDLANTYRSRQLRFSMAYRTRRFLLEHPCAAYLCNGASCHRKVDKEIKKLVIREDGTVLPEISTLDYRFALGNLREGTLVELVARYFSDGYEKFDRLCRTIYEEVMPTWTAPLIPWNEIVSDRSWTFDA